MLNDSMSDNSSQNILATSVKHDGRSHFYALIAIAAVVALTTVQLRLQGRLWWCACGGWNIWSGDVWSSHNSQHLLDPYSFTHVLHGVIFCGLLKRLFPRWQPIWRLLAAVVVECLWEIVENTDFIINRYREATMSLDYFGDSVINSLGDILTCTLGFLLARRIGIWRSVVFFLVTEVILLFWIRDNLFLNIVMLVHPFDAIKAWQMGQ